MSEAGAAQILLERLIATGGFAVRNNTKEDAFGYTSGKPGPFYINTENIAGAQTAQAALDKITKILQMGLAPAQIAKAVLATIDDAVAKDAEYRRSIKALRIFICRTALMSPLLSPEGREEIVFFDSYSCRTRSFLAEGNIQTSTNMTKQARIEQFKQTDLYGLKSEFPAFFS